MSELAMIARGLERTFQALDRIQEQKPVPCERCKRTHDPAFGGEPIQLRDNDWCSDCNFHVGWEEHGDGGLCGCNLLPCVQKRGDCWRYLSDADCDTRCCRGCHQEERLGDDSLGAQCLTEMAEDYREMERDQVRECCCGKCPP